MEDANKYTDDGLIYSVTYSLFHRIDILVAEQIQSCTNSIGPTRRRSANFVSAAAMRSRRQSEQMGTTHPAVSPWPLSFSTRKSNTRSPEAGSQCTPHQFRFPMMYLLLGEPPLASRSNIGTWTRQTRGDDECRPAHGLAKSPPCFRLCPCDASFCVSWLPASTPS